MKSRNARKLSIVAVGALGAIGSSTLTAPASASTLSTAWNFYGQSQFIYGYEEVTYGCWRLSGTRVPELQAKVDGQWTSVAKGQLDVPTGFAPVTCTDPEYPTVVYYPWLVQTRGTPSGNPDYENLEVRPYLAGVPAATNTTVYKKKTYNYACKSPSLARWRYVEKTFYPSGHSPITKGRYVKRCKPGTGFKSKWPVWVKATVTRETSPAIPEYAATSRVKKIYLRIPF